MERWWLSRDGSGGVFLRGDIHDDPPPRSFPDGDGITSSHLDEEQQRRAVEGTIVSTASGRRYILGAPATYDTLADQRDAAVCKVNELQEKLAAIERAANPKKKPRGRAPDGCSWDEQKGGWFDENGERHVQVRNPKRQKAAAARRVGRRVRREHSPTCAIPQACSRLSALHLRQALATMTKEEDIEEKYKGFYGNHNTMWGCNLDTSPDSKMQLAQRARRARERHERGACPYQRCAAWGMYKCVCNELGEDPLRRSPPGRPYDREAKKAFWDKGNQKRLELFGDDICVDERARRDRACRDRARRGRSTAEDELEDELEDRLEDELEDGEDGEDGEDTDKEGWGAYEF